MTHTTHKSRLTRAILGTLCGVGCGSSGGGTPDSANDPTNVPFGTTTIVVVVNPVVNDANMRDVPSPGPTRSGVKLTTDDLVIATTGTDGIAVLPGVTAGLRTITVAGPNVGGSFNVTIADGALREVAVATTGTSALVMVELEYKNDRVTQLTPMMSNADVNNALKVSDTVVFLAGGRYAGDLDFSGSRVTLFGEGVRGGEVFLDGNVVMSGSNSRIRGTTISGNLMIPASGVGLSFSRVNGTITSQGSDGTVLSNALCGMDTITGSGTTMLGNVGAAPITTCP